MEECFLRDRTLYQGARHWRVLFRAKMLLDSDWFEKLDLMS